MGAAAVLIFILIVAALALTMFQMKWTWHVVRPRLEATWPMIPGLAEGFTGSADALLSVDGIVNPGLRPAGGINSPNLKLWLPNPDALTKPNSGDCPAVLNNAGHYTAGIGKPQKSQDLLDDWMKGIPEPRVAFGPTSQDCYKVDYARSLERAGSQAQRTNNYRHGYPDSCSAPNHDFVLDFYEPRPTAGPYQV